MPRTSGLGCALAPIPHNEKARLEALSHCGVLDLFDDPQLDDLTREARSVFKTPMSLLSIVDKTDLQFVSRQGVCVTSVPRDFTFCSHAIVQVPEHPFVVRDTFKDQRFYSSPLVTDAPNLRFYAGALLRLSSGYRIGTLNVVDKSPKTVIPRRELLELVKLADKAVKIIEEHAAVSGAPSAPRDMRLSSLDLKIGLRIQQKRKELHFSPQHLEAKLSLEPGDLNLIERGEKRISTSELLLLSRVLKVELFYFFR